MESLVDMDRTLVVIVVILAVNGITDEAVLHISIYRQGAACLIDHPPIGFGVHVRIGLGAVVVVVQPVFHQMVAVVLRVPEMVSHIVRSRPSESHVRFFGAIGGRRYTAEIMVTQMFLTQDIRPVDTRLFRDILHAVFLVFLIGFDLLRVPPSVGIVQRDVRAPVGCVALGPVQLIVLLVVVVEVILVVPLVAYAVKIDAVGVVSTVPLELLFGNAVPGHVHFLHAAESGQGNSGLLAVVPQSAVVGEEIRRGTVTVTVGVHLR